MERTNFEVDIPYGSKVIGIHGSYNAHLLGIAAFYD
jgi:hypothetical protein